MGGIGWINEIPTLTGVQAKGVMPIVKAFKNTANNFLPEANPETIATVIRIGNPISRKKALTAIYKTGGYSGIYH